MAQDLRSQDIKNPIDVAEYLFRRLKQVGVESIHGLPGDYNLVALDYIPKTGLKWVGNCNELNAGTQPPPHTLRRTTAHVIHRLRC
jgi:pyruvate decarboxylase